MSIVDVGDRLKGLLRLREELEGSGRGLAQKKREIAVQIASLREAIVETHGDTIRRVLVAMLDRDAFFSYCCSTLAESEGFLFDGIAGNWFVRGLKVKGVTLSSNLGVTLNADGGLSWKLSLEVPSLETAERETVLSFVRGKISEFEELTGIKISFVEA